MTGLLEVRGLNVVFDGFRAVTDLDFSVAAGELRFVIGPNGAGKTTLIDVITGRTRPASGSVRFDGHELVGQREHRIVRMGIGRTFQTSVVFEELTVGENLDLAAQFRRPLVSLLRRRRAYPDDVVAVLDTTGLGELVDQPAGVLSHGQRQWLEIGMLMVQQPRLLLLDEPVAGMSREERERTGVLLREVAQTHTVVVVEHDMEFLRRFATVVTVLHEGRLLCQGTVAEVQADPRVQEVYLGRARKEAVDVDG
ncbi:urea ABC transporter ATP-binding protein UrtD [Dactylosporangium fulvum]|uniref:Urea ABC transporter ATP-binding protein UrtD n=1 Tax=Dactylosporangium fulvum TaxID=53359 RepID=A0ABY5VWX0_9ACTN|nr:urea ABC transporter ATP-binding protein UrtD [Dactylosporangium fulvum]UWP82120.1 urea ABC transporter ATP-binding protein UrtD [Dactylosporangium fulvum]